MALIALAVKLTSKGPALHWSDRVGQKNRIFRMPKFRSMRTNAPEIAKHLLSDQRSDLTPIGAFLRLSSLDELPQLVSIMIGDLSFVGPRPALFNQDDLIKLRTERGIHLLRPGLTGWAQVNGRDELEVPEKVRFDSEYREKRSFKFDLQIIGITIEKVLRCKDVKL
jgi:O-antigen biosynthesis protein WbqP